MVRNSCSIAIIDDGVNEGYYNLGDLQYNLEITPELKIIHRSSYDKYMPSHATVCAGIIRKYAPHASIGSIKILNEERKGLCGQLVKAIQWCIKEGIGLINLSLGTIYRKDSAVLREAVNLAANNGLVIVAAFSNSRIISYPSFFSNVIGVKCDRNNELEEGQYVYNAYPADCINITASGRYLLKQFDGIESYTQICNSYAAPLVTAKVYNIIENCPEMTLEGIKSKLAEGASSHNTENLRPYLYKNIDWAEQAIVFEFNDDNGCYEKLQYIFKTTDIQSLKCSCLSEGLKHIRQYIENNRGMTEEADTIVINLNNLTGMEFDCTSEKVLELLSYTGKNIIYLDDREKDKDLENIDFKNKVKVWHPSIYKYLDTSPWKDPDIPMVALYDFSGGCLVDFLCRLQECFQNDGYNIVAAANTCQGIVYGLEYSPAMDKNVNQGTDPYGLKVLFGLYRPDILIYGIGNLVKNVEYAGRVDDYFEVDINIIIADGYNKNVEEFVCTGRDSNIIFLSYESPVFRLLKNKENCMSFDLSSETCISEVYNYIISLYNNA